MDNDDPRRWRDDGKRDERVAARREREYRERERARDRPSRDESWDASGGRWTLVEERGDGRNKRSSGRDRRSGALDDVKEKDDRRDREKEREKEPAWMDTYIPSDSGSGILSSKGGDGELDGIQAFKKVMKIKEQKDTALDEPLEATDTDRPSLLARAGPTSASSERGLDEIQLFKLMMKKEQEQKTTDLLQTSTSEPTLTGPTLQEIEKSVATRARDPRTPSTLGSTSLFIDSALLLTNNQ